MHGHPRREENCHVQSSLHPNLLFPFPRLSVSVAVLHGESAGWRGNGADQGARQIACVGQKSPMDALRNVTVNFEREGVFYCVKLFFSGQLLNFVNQQTSSKRQTDKVTLIGRLP